MRGLIFLATFLLISAILAGLFGGRVIEFGHAEHMTTQPDGEELYPVAAMDPPMPTEEQF